MRSISQAIEWRDRLSTTIESAERFLQPIGAANAIEEMRAGRMNGARANTRETARKPEPDKASQTIRFSNQRACSSPAGHGHAHASHPRVGPRHLHSPGTPLFLTVVTVSPDKVILGQRRAFRISVAVISCRMILLRACYSNRIWNLTNLFFLHDHELGTQLSDFLFVEN